MIRIFASRQFVAFLLTGGVAALVNFLSRIVYSHWLGYSAAIFLAYLTGMITAFFLARVLVFRESRRSLHYSAAMFCLVNVFAAFQTWAVSLILADYLLPLFGVTRHVPELAHAVGIVVPVFTSFIGHKRLSFG